MQPEISFQNFQNPKKEDQQLTFYLTISAILEKNDEYSKVFWLQEKLFQDLKPSKNIGNGIYRYPKDRIHFSILNFTDFSKTNTTEKAYRKQNADNILTITEKLSEFIKDNAAKVLDNEIIFSNIYSCSSSSISLQANLSDNLSNFFEEMVKYFDGFGGVNIKANEFLFHGMKIKKFSVNLARFFSEVKKRITR